MIDKFCDFVMQKIKQNMDALDEEKEMVIDFGVRLIFGELPKIVLLFIIGFILGVGWYTIAFFFLLAAYRSFTGGFHLKTHLGCMVTTSMLYLGPILLAKYITISQEYVLYILAALVGTFSVFVICKYAPADTENVPILSKKERKVKKIKAYISLTILLGIILFSPTPMISYMFIYGITLQNLTVLPISYKITNNKYGYEVYQDEVAS
ncbi:MAG: accessory gene regulator B family protein [Clostridia bacterium]|nr:accessory gene regulator B family protein [Clostridia bacterium]